MPDIDPARDGISSMLEQGRIGKSAADEALPTATKPEVIVGQPRSHPEGERRRNAPKLNVYVNPFPEWRLARATAKTITRKQSGIRCPRCGSCDTRQSLTRSFTDRLLFLFDFINARCRNCNKRFRVFRSSLPEKNSKFQDAAPEVE